MLVLYGIRNCDTIKQVIRWLDQQGADYQFHDYKKSGCPEALAQEFLQHFSVDEVINKRGTTWRKLPEQLKLSVDRSSAPALMQEYPSLIKRPLLNIGGRWVAGFDRDRIAALLPQ